MSPSARRLRKTIHSAENLVLMGLMAAERDKAGLSQQKLAKRLGKHQSFVAKYEGGERRLDVAEFVAIVRAMGADPVRILRLFMRRIG
jgi:transcriptional regulator with XRE-family HTH domain